MSRNDKRSVNLDGEGTPRGETPKVRARREKAEQMRVAQARAARRRSVVVALSIGLGLVVVVAAVVFVVLASNDDSSSIARDDVTGGPTPAAVTDDGSFVVGNPDAPVTVQVVEDFQCPVCQAFEAAAGAQLDEYAAGDDVKVEYRGIAFLDGQSSTDYSSRALNASACVMDEGAEVWKEFHRQLYLQQPAEGGEGLPDQTLVDIATTAGADEDAVAGCVEDQTYAGWVADTTTAAGEDGVSGTPTLFVDGQQLPSSDPAALQAAVDAALG